MNNNKKTAAVLARLSRQYALLLYLFALVQAVVRSYLSIEQCRITAGNEFAGVKFLAISSSSQGIMDEKFKETLNNALIETKTIEALIITGTSGEYYYFENKTVLLHG